MKKLIVITSVLLIYISGLCQEKSGDRDGVWLRINQNSILKSKPVAIGYDLFQVEKKTKLLVIDVTQVSWLYKVIYNDKVYYASNTAFDVNEELV